MRAIERVHIIGMGALGILFGNIIAENMGQGHVFYIMDQERYDRHKNDTCTINGAEKEFSIIKAGDAPHCDLLIVAVKSTGLEEALDTMESSVGEDTIIISVLNGISSEEVIGRRYGMERVIPTVAQGMDAMYFGTALAFTKTGQLYTGITDPSMKEKLERLTSFFDRSGVPYTVEKDITRRMWSKFMLNVGINQTCMVYGTTYSGAMKPGSVEYMTLISAMREVILIAGAENVDLTEADLKQYIALLKTLSPDATPSMGQDRINRRISESEIFSGTVLRIAEKHNIPVPANEFLYSRVREIEKDY